MVQMQEHIARNGNSKMREMEWQGKEQLKGKLLEICAAGPIHGRGGGRAQRGTYIL